MNYIGNIIKGTFAQQYSFTIGDPETQDYESIWKQHKGTKDNIPISVFILDLVRFPDKKILAMNALKRLKTIRHPSIIKFIDAVQSETQIIIATERVSGLSRQLNANNNSNFIVWGLFKMANVVKFLNDQGIVHGHLRIGSIFTVPSGEWKLFGLEYTSLLNEQDSVFNIYRNQIRNSHLYLPKESRDNTASGIDGFSFGALIYQIYNGNYSRIEDLVSRGNIPLNLFEQYKAFVNTRNRLDLGVFLETASRKGGFFDNSIIWTSLFLEEINIKESWEKEEFIRKIAQSLHEFPIEYSKYKVLPELLKAVEYGGAGANALSSTLKLGSQLNQDEFTQLILPTVINLFSVQDNNIRSCLYENLESIIKFIPQKVVNDKLFASLASGFEDGNPSIREQALKSILHVAPKLNDRNMNKELFRYLSKLQIDPQPGIRTNATICIGKLSKLFNSTTQKRVLAPTFLRALGDPFPPARNAALLALSATAEYYEIEEIASKILPVYSRLLIDPEKLVREQAFKNMHSFLKILEKHSASMPEVNREPAPSQVPKANGSSQQIPGGTSWGDWALSTVSSKLAGAIIDPDPSERQSLDNLANSKNPKISSHNQAAPPSVPSVTKSSSFAGNNISSFNSNLIQVAPQKPTTSASKPLVLSTKPKNDLDFGWGDWENDILDQPSAIKADSATGGLAPVLQPQPLKRLSVKETSPNTFKDPMWPSLDDEWGWNDPVKSSMNHFNSSSNGNNGSYILNTKNDWNAQNDWNTTTADEWDSWAEPSFGKSHHNNNTWSPKSSTTISIDKLKGENRKKKLQEMNTSRIGEKK